MLFFFKEAPGSSSLGSRASRKILYWKASCSGLTTKETAWEGKDQHTLIRGRGAAVKEGDKGKKKAITKEMDNRWMKTKGKALKMILKGSQK